MCFTVAGVQVPAGCSGGCLRKSSERRGPYKESNPLTRPAGNRSGHRMIAMRFPVSLRNNISLKEGAITETSSTGGSGPEYALSGNDF